MIDKIICLIIGFCIPMGIMYMIQYIPCRP